MKLIYLLVPVLLLLAACAAEPTLAPNPTATDILSTPAPTQTLANTPASNATRVPATSSPAVPSPVVTRGPGGTIVIAGNGTATREITKLPEFVSHALFDSLLRVDPKDGHLLPGLAVRWLISEDAKTFVFILREGVTWSDGTPLTADDVAFTLQAFSDPKIRTNPAADFGPIDTITATDSRTVSVTFKSAYCAALTYIGTIPILSKARLEKKSLTDVANEDLIGTGPLILKTWTDSEITFTHNQKYWNGVPQIVDWTYRMFPSDAAARAAVQDGAADFVVSDAAVSSAQTIPVAQNEFYALAFNTKRAPFDDVSVRQAIALALDRGELANAFNPPQLPLATSLLPPFWAAPHIDAPVFDLNKARQGLANAGWRDIDGDGFLEKDGKTLEVTLWAEAEKPESELTVQLVRAQLAKVGVRAVVKLTEHILFLTRVFLHEFDLALVPFNIPLDPDQHYFWSADEVNPGFGLNVTGYSNTAVEAALKAGNSTARCDSIARKNAYAPVFQQLAFDTPMVFLFAPVQAASTSGALAGVNPSPFAGIYWNMNTWEVAQ